MGACKSYIDKLKKELPELCDVSTLVEAGFFSSDQQAYNMRVNDNGPEYFRIAGRYKYPKDGIIEYLKHSWGGGI